jgi:hypothetical protein
MDSDYFQTSEAEDVLGSLRHLKLCLAETEHDPQAWKWVVLSLFSAAQGAIVCHAAGTTQIECLTKDSATKVLAWLENPVGTMPDEKLAGPDTLFKRMNGTFTDIPPCGGVIPTAPRTAKAFQRIKHLRDDFLHFRPKGWSIEKDYVKHEIATLSVLLRDIDDRGWAFRHLEPRGIVSQTIDEIGYVL